MTDLGTKIETDEYYLLIVVYKLINGPATESFVPRDKVQAGPQSCVAHLHPSQSPRKAAAYQVSRQRP